MSNDVESKQKELDRIAKELSASRLSRRGLLDRLKAVGVGFGAAFMLGAKQSDAHNALDAAARLQSTNTALNNIIEEGSRAATTGEGESAPKAEDRPVQTAYRRVFRRVYSRI
jgi:hypothetical protein